MKAAIATTRAPLLNTVLLQFLTVGTIENLLHRRLAKKALHVRAVVGTCVLPKVEWQVRSLHAAVRIYELNSGRRRPVRRVIVGPIDGAIENSAVSSDSLAGFL